MLHALLVDDDPAIHRILERELRQRGCTSESASSGEQGLAAARAQRPALILLDIHMAGMSGIETLKRLTREVPGVPVVIMTGEGSIELAVEAFKAGAVDFVTKPFDRPKLLSAIDASLNARGGATVSGPPIIGGSPALVSALELAKRFAWPDINVLLEGETGTGKELFARTIHAASKRREGPFIAVDCSNLSGSLIESELFGHEKDAFTGASARRIGRFEQANGGTLFLDEVGNLPLELQSKLLRVLQQRTIERVGGNVTIPLDIRLVSAANVNLREKIDQGKFKLDLYFRLAEATINPPPLRDREGDVERLANFFLQKYAAEFKMPVRGISSEALERLKAHSFPGNVRELEGMLKSAVVHAYDDELVRAEHLPKELGGPRSARAPASSPASASARPGSVDGQRLKLEITIDEDDLDLKAIGTLAGEQAQSIAIQHVLAKGKHSIADLARIMKVDVKTVKDKLSRYGLR